MKINLKLGTLRESLPEFITDKFKQIDFIAIDINYLHRQNKDEEFIAKLIFHEYLHHYLDSIDMKGIDQDKYISDKYGV